MTGASTASIIGLIPWIVVAGALLRTVWLGIGIIRLRALQPSIDNCRVERRPPDPETGAGADGGGGLARRSPAAGDVRRTAPSRAAAIAAARPSEECQHAVGVPRARARGARRLAGDDCRGTDPDGLVVSPGCLVGHRPDPAQSRGNRRRARRRHHRRAPRMHGSALAFCRWARASAWQRCSRAAARSSRGSEQLSQEVVMSRTRLAPCGNDARRDRHRFDVERRLRHRRFGRKCAIEPSPRR